MRFAVGIALLAGFGCTGTEELDGHTHSTDDESDCASAEDFVVGLQKSTPAGVVVTLIDATPAPPYRGVNAWTIGLTDSGAAPIPDATLTVTPWMPLHNHGLVPPDYTGTGNAAGVYIVAPFELTMPGQWEFTVDAGDGDSVKYIFCVEG